MFSIFDYLRRIVRDSVLAGVQDAFEIMDHGNHRDSITTAARDFLNRSSTPLPAPVPPEARPAQPRAGEPAQAQVPPGAPSDLIPQSFQLPPEELPKLDGYDNYERRKKGEGRPPKQPHPRST